MEAYHSRLRSSDKRKGRAARGSGVGSAKASRLMKFCAVLSAFVIVAVAGFFVANILFSEAELNVTDLEYGSVVYEIKEGEKFSPDKYIEEGGEDKYGAVDIFGRLNWKFMNQPIGRRECRER